MRKKVTIVGSGNVGATAAHWIASKELADVVLIDITLGAESGFELARHLAEHARDGGPAMILISTHAEADFADLIADSPATGFLPKSQLSADAIRRILDRRSD